jgi:hypothetical protein
MLLIQYECVTSLTTTTSTTTTTLQTTATTTLINYCPTTEATPVGTCSTTSQVTPQFITTSTSTYFEYQIFEQIVCSSGVLFIRCPTNLVIHIKSAYYGIQAQTTTSCIDR